MSIKWNFVEVNIPLSKGFVRGKWWGPTDKRPILAMHGWLDNCGTFDRLIPYLPPNIGVLAIDMPGHGLSSPLPKGSSLNYFQEVTIIREIFLRFKWKKISLLGHSLGAVEQSFYAAMYPNDVDFIIVIDLLYSLVTDIALPFHTSQDYANKVDKFLTFFVNPKPIQGYSYPQCVEKYCKSVLGSVTAEYAPYVLERGLIRGNEGKYYFSADPVVACTSFPSINKDEYQQLISTITAPMLFVKAEKSRSNPMSRSYFRTVSGQLERSLKVFRLVVVDEPHHVQLMAPESIGKQVCDFILEFDSQDREQKPGLINEIQFIKHKI